MERSKKFIGQRFTRNQGKASANTFICYKVITLSSKSNPSLVTDTTMGFTYIES